MNLDFLTDSAVINIIVAAADILVVSYIIYRVLLLIRGTRAQQMLVGLGLIILAFFASRFLGFKTLSWILDNFISSILLVVIVVFQNDIRRGLQRVGRRNFFGAMGFGPGTFLADELMKAAEVMARDRTGAIILIEREATLSELADTGVRLDAKVSGSLLAQLFVTPGPLHDGALIIQGSRITAAAVFLPLSQNPQLSPYLGTRHRAAVGATEELDALAIVISEERGQISLAESGVLHRNLEPEKLKSMLQQYFGELKEGQAAKDKQEQPPTSAGQEGA